MIIHCTMVVNTYDNVKFRFLKVNARAKTAHFPGVTSGRYVEKEELAFSLA
ncbi:hypothetical protein ACFLX5_05980 [Chloroflexota bacterium]